MSDRNKNGHDPEKPKSLEDITYAPLTRRSFLKAGIAAAALSTGSAVALSPIMKLDQPLSLDEFLQQHYERLTPEQMK